MIENFERVVFCLARVNKLTYTFPSHRENSLNAEWRREIFFLKTLIILQFMTTPRIPDSLKIFSTIPAITESALLSLGPSTGFFDREYTRQLIKKLKKKII